MENGSIWYTMDAGATWTAAMGAPTVFIGQYSFGLVPLASDRRLSNVHYLVNIDASGNTLIWRTSDGGANWAQVGSIPVTVGSPINYGVACDPLVANKVWVDLSTGQGVYKSTNGGATWTKVGALVGQGLIAFGKPAPGRTNSSVVFFGDVNGSGDRRVFVSPDDGATWLPFPKFSFPTVYDFPPCLGADRQTYGRAYIGTYGRGLFVGDLQPPPAPPRLR